MLVLGLVLVAHAHHSHPVRSRLHQYGAVPVRADPGVTGVLQIIAGFLDAVGTKTNETEIVSCLTDLDSVDSSITSAVAELKLMTWDSVEAGIRDVANALEVVPNAMNACAGSVPEDEQLVKGLLAKFEHPSTFFFQVELHLMVDGVDILSNVNGAISDWNSGDWFGFGSDLGTAMVLVVDGGVQKLSAAHTLAVVTGLLEGISADLGLTDIQDCIQDVGTLGTDIHSAYEELLQATFDSVKSGLADLSDALQQLPAAIQSCKAADTTDIAKIEAALSSFKNPISFVFHVGHDLIVNGKQIFTEVEAAVVAYHSKNYEAFGNAMGQALAALIVGEQPAKINVAHTLEVVAGLLEGIASDLGLSDIENCIEDAETLGEDIHNAYEQILQATFTSVKNGLEDLAAALKVIPAAISSCKSAATSDVTKLEAMLATFSSPETFVFHVAKDLIVNGHEIYTEVAAAVRAYHSGDYTSFGFNMGEALAAVIVGETDVAVNVIDVLGGLLAGIADGIAITDIENCVTDTETVAANLADAVMELRDAANATNAKAAIHDFGMTLEFLPGAITNCKSAATNDAADIAEMIKNFESPLSFIFVVGKNLVLNGNEIYDEMTTAIADWDSQSWFAFGQNLGEAMAKTFL